MWTESLFTVYQALDWECFSDAEETFSHLSGPVRKKKTFEEFVEKTSKYAGLGSYLIHKIG